MFLLFLFSSLCACNKMCPEEDGSCAENVNFGGLNDSKNLTSCEYWEDGATYAPDLSCVYTVRLSNSGDQERVAL